MGCDIHIVLERKDEAHDKWVGVRHYAYQARTMLGLPREASASSWVGYVIKNRNYDFFNDLCGVRGNGSAFGYTDQGLPEDMSDMTRLILHEDSDLHSHSWLTMDELRPVLMKHFITDKQRVAAVKDRLVEGRPALDPVTMFVDDDITPENEHLFRLVFAFDN